MASVSIPLDDYKQLEDKLESLEAKVIEQSVEISGLKTEKIKYQEIYTERGVRQSIRELANKSSYDSVLKNSLYHILQEPPTYNKETLVISEEDLETKIKEHLAETIVEKLEILETEKQTLIKDLEVLKVKSREDITSTIAHFNKIIKENDDKCVKLQKQFSDANNTLLVKKVNGLEQVVKSLQKKNEDLTSKIEIYQALPVLERLTFNFD